MAYNITIYTNRNDFDHEITEEDIRGFLVGELKDAFIVFYDTLENYEGDIAFHVGWSKEDVCLSKAKAGLGNFQYIGCGDEEYYQLFVKHDYTEEEGVKKVELTKDEISTIRNLARRIAEIYE